jgi:long-chain acyl-CoA synthetase
VVLVGQLTHEPGMPCPRLQDRVRAPDAARGEEIGAAVALKPGAEADPVELIEFVRERLATYKRPRLVWFVDTLPKEPSGKILRREVAPPAVRK